MLDEHLRQFTVFAETLTEYMLKHGERVREFAKAYVERRRRMGLPAVDPERLAFNRAVEVVSEQLWRIDLLTSRDVAAAVRSTRAVVRQAERRKQFERFVSAIVVHSDRHLERLRAEAAVENRVRRQRGRPSVRIESFIAQIAAEEVLPELNVSLLCESDARAARQAAQTRIHFSAKPVGVGGLVSITLPCR